MMGLRPRTMSLGRGLSLAWSPGCPQQPAASWGRRRCSPSGHGLGKGLQGETVISYTGFSSAALSRERASFPNFRRWLQASHPVPAFLGQVSVPMTFLSLTRLRGPISKEADSKPWSQSGAKLVFQPSGVLLSRQTEGLLVGGTTGPALTLPLTAQQPFPLCGPSRAPGVFPGGPAYNSPVRITPVTPLIVPNSSGDGGFDIGDLLNIC